MCSHHSRPFIKPWFLHFIVIRWHIISYGKWANKRKAENEKWDSDRGGNREAIWWDAFTKPYHLLIPNINVCSCSYGLFELCTQQIRHNTHYIEWKQSVFDVGIKNFVINFSTFIHFICISCLVISCSFYLDHTFYRLSSSSFFCCCIFFKQILILFFLCLFFFLLLLYLWLFINLSHTHHQPS